MSAALLMVLSGAWRALRRLPPVRALLLGYLLYALMGWVLLCLPWMHYGEATTLDHLFTAVSAMSTTGLATVSTPGTYTGLGQGLILCLIQLGGLGYMTLGSLVLLGVGSELTVARERVARSAFALPNSVEVKRFLVQAALYTVAVETLGALALYAAFSQAGVDNALWQAVFHSISAFCTAGFSLFSDSLVGFRDNVAVNAIIAALSLGGAMGFLVVYDVVASLSAPKRKITLTARIIISVTLWGIFGGSMLLFVTEPSVAALEAESRLLTAMFQAMSALTTVGFNTDDLGLYSSATVLVMLALMIVGASPAGTGGGLKSTSLSTALAAALSALRGEDHVRFRGCEIPRQRIMTAYAALVFYLGTFFVGGLLLLLLETAPFEDLLFETASALGTVGLSRGITGELRPLSKLVVIVLMFVGRMGPLSFGLAVLGPQPAPKHPEEEERVQDLAV